MASNHGAQKLTIRIPLHNIKLVDFAGVFRKHIESNLLTELSEYGLIQNNEINIKNPNVKRLFYHHTILGICNYILNLKTKDKAIIVYSNLVDPGRDLHNYVCPENLRSFFNRLVQTLIKILPLKIMIVSQTFKIIKKYIRNNNGEGADIINSAKSIADTYDITRFTFNKARSFGKRHGLNFLTNNFFKQIKCKQLILS